MSPTKFPTFTKENAHTKREGSPQPPSPCDFIKSGLPTRGGELGYLPSVFSEEGWGLLAAPSLCSFCEPAARNKGGGAGLPDLSGARGLGGWVPLLQIFFALGYTKSLLKFPTGMLLAPSPPAH